MKAEGNCELGNPMRWPRAGRREHLLADEIQTLWLLAYQILGTVNSSGNQLQWCCAKEQCIFKKAKALEPEYQRQSHMGNQPDIIHCTRTALTSARRRFSGFTLTLWDTESSTSIAVEFSLLMLTRNCWKMTHPMIFAATPVFSPVPLPQCSSIFSNSPE